jgi:hypothetical protein
MSLMNLAFFCLLQQNPQKIMYHCRGRMESAASSLVAHVLPMSWDRECERRAVLFPPATNCPSRRWNDGWHALLLGPATLLGPARHYACLGTAPANQSPVSSSCAESNGDDRDERHPPAHHCPCRPSPHPSPARFQKPKPPPPSFPLSPSVLFLVPWASLCSSPIKKLVETLADTYKKLQRGRERWTWVPPATGLPRVLLQPSAFYPPEDGEASERGPAAPSCPTLASINAPPWPSLFPRRWRRPPPASRCPRAVGVVEERTKPPSSDRRRRIAGPAPAAAASRHPRVGLPPPSPRRRRRRLTPPPSPLQGRANERIGFHGASFCLSHTG